jgi:hypothetical protein
MLSLRINGVVVLPFIGDPKGHSQLFQDSLARMCDLPSDPPLVLGSFGALGSASTFHDKFVRDQRLALDKEFTPQLKNVFPDKLVQMVLDRVGYRPAGMAPCPEGAHRDLTQVDMCLKGDIITGGFINNNATEPQFFTCVLGTHTEVDNHTQGLGFSAVIKERMAEINANNMWEKIEIPPGHVLLFDQRLVHRVNSTKYKHPIMRTYISFRMTTSDVPLLHNIREILEQGAVPLLKSGQMPYMYPQLYLANWQHLLINESKRFPEAMKEDKKFSGKCLANNNLEHGSYTVLKRVCPSLREMGIEFEPYTQQEIDMFFSH